MGCIQSNTVEVGHETLCTFPGIQSACVHASWISLENKTNAEMMAATLKVLSSVMMHVQMYLDSIMHCSLTL